MALNLHRRGWRIDPTQRHKAQCRQRPQERHADGEPANCQKQQ
jgi:hypothetical protein